MAQGASGWGSAHPTPRESDTLPLSDALSLGKVPEALLGAAETQAGELSLPQASLRVLAPLIDGGMEHLHPASKQGS